MKNGKKIVIISMILMLLVTGGNIFFSKKSPTQYGYQLINTTGTSKTSIATGSIANQVSSDALAYINSWNGDVKREQNGSISTVTNKLQLTQGDRLITGKDANAEIIFADNSIVRMNANSKLSFVKIASAGSEVRLNEGDIWARVLKPFYDKSFFTISTSDVSAGVQGTSVRIQKTLSGTTSVAVIDSYSQVVGKEGVVLRYNNPTSKKVTEQVLKPENEFTYANSGSTAVIKSFSGKVAFTDSFIRENTKRDLIYMNDLSEKKGNDENLMKRLKGELVVTMPKSDEVSEFFDEPMLEKIVSTSIKEYQGNVENAQVSTSLIENIRKDISINENRREISKLKQRLNEDIKNEKEKKQLEEIVHEKERQINTTIQDIEKEVKNFESNNTTQLKNIATLGDKEHNTPTQKQTIKVKENKIVQQRTRTPSQENKKENKNTEMKKSEIKEELQKNTLNEVNEIIGEIKSILTSYKEYDNGSDSNGTSYSEQEEFITSSGSTTSDEESSLERTSECEKNLSEGTMSDNTSECGKISSEGSSEEHSSYGGGSSGGSYSSTESTHTENSSSSTSTPVVAPAPEHHEEHKEERREKRKHD